MYAISLTNDSSLFEAAAYFEASSQKELFLVKFST
jgi:hypothetical protein